MGGSSPSRVIKFLNAPERPEQGDYNYLCTYDLYSPVQNVWMRTYPLQGKVGGGWALEYKSFLDPVKWHRADRQVPFRAQKTNYNYARGCINHRCINSY
jgi:hypothetical protein